MNIWKISIQNIKSKALYTFLSILTLALSIALLLGIQQIKNSFEHQLENNIGEIDLVIGAKGSPLQLILASVLHLDNPTGNIPYIDAKKLGKHPMVKTAVPISYGDNYKGYRIVGTTDKFLSLYHAEIASGRRVEHSLEVVIGHRVAERTGLKLGDTFLSSHGLVDNDIDVHNNKIKVVGILKPTGNVIDRLMITNLESIWEVHEHEQHNEDHDGYDKDHYGEEHSNHDDHDEDHLSEEHASHDDHNKYDEDHHDEQHSDHENHHEDDKEITSLLISFRSPAAFLTFPRRINEKTNMQAALPKFELDRLYEFTGIGLTTITWIAYLILLISGIIIFVSLYKMVKERSFDLALLRTYGASNLQLIKMVALEGLIVLIIAFSLGYLFVKVGLKYMFSFLSDNKQNMLQELPFEDVLQTTGMVFAVIVLSILIAIYPIIKMNISTILSNEK